MSTEKLEQPKTDRNNQWENLSDIEFAGNRSLENTENPTHSPEESTLYNNIAEIRAILDTRVIAEKKDPDGLAKAQKEDQDILTLCALQRKELEDKSTEYKTLSKEQDEYYESGKCNELKNAKAKRKKSRTHKILAFFHRPDKLLDSIVAEETKAEKRSKKIIELASGGYSNDEKIEAKKRSIDNTLRTATNEDEFLSGFETPLSREQKDRLLDYSTLAKLSTNEYLRLWRHLNPQYVSHVTRQGYRDHSAMFYHTAGLGEMSKNFIDALKSGKILHPSINLATGLPKTDLLKDGNVFRSYMEKTYFQNGIPEPLLESEDLSPNAIAGSMSGGHGVLSQPDGFWRDKTALHVGANNVLDTHYGAESGNEIFYVFPADVVASQSGVNIGLLHEAKEGQPKNRTIKVGNHDRTVPYSGERTHNDVLVFAKNGLPLDAGLVFLPKSTLVNPNTGSKYYNFNSETMTGTIMTKEMGGIPAEEYWENYFKEHIEEKPAHIIYYDGDPETAVAKTLAENGIYVGNHGDTSGETGRNLGFDDKIAYGGTELDSQLKEEAQNFFAKVADYIRSKRNESS